MGSPSSKFKKFIQNGDEFAAMQVYQGSPEVRKSFDPNLSFGEAHNHNTALHYAAKHGMKHLLRMFLNDSGGNPNKRNGSNETVLHACCALVQHKSYSAHERKSTCVSIVLQWRGAILDSGEKEKIEIDTKDVDGNTALHHAAANGLTRCAQLLIAAGSSVFAENNERMTACDLATAKRHHNLARLLEAKMVFTETTDIINEAEISSNSSLVWSEQLYSGLKPEDLREVKDELLLDTSDMLNVSLSTAQALLRENEWSRETLLEKWIEDPTLCCINAGVPTPNFDDSVRFDVETDFECGICLMNHENGKNLECGHKFCPECWKTYLTNKISEGEVSRILCPETSCNLFVTLEFLFETVPKNVLDNYLFFDIKNFVEESPKIKWCPVKNCKRAVKLEGASKSVDCGIGHFFCWDCSQDAHVPSTCDEYNNWMGRIAKIQPDNIDASNFHEIANSLWIVTNSKPCPNCGSNIQKGDGCNHIRCFKCKHDFCWVCLESWKKHSSSTGGYFRCNRLEAVQKAEQKQAIVLSDAIRTSRESSDLAKFLNYYGKFRKHEMSRKMEEPLMKSVKQKMATLAVTNKDKGENCAVFLEDGVKELLKARRVLCGCYVHAFFIDDIPKKAEYEEKLTEFEEVTEKLSEILGRPYLKTPKAVIVGTTCLVKKRRVEISRGNDEKKEEKKCDPDNLTGYLPVTGDDTMELAIALEMSRLQMIEEEMIRLKGAGSSTSTVIDHVVDPELNLAIERSLQDSVKSQTVRDFLKSLGDDWSGDIRNDYRQIRTKGEDGRFQIGDVHQNGVYLDQETPNLRRSHSTGELGPKIKDERYHLDSDHSSQHDDRPEELRRRLKQSPEQSSLDESDTQTKKRPNIEALSLSRDKISSFSLSSESSSLENQKLEAIHESGIPKSPNLYISGVSICRTPEAKSPGKSFAEETVFKFTKSSTEGALSSILHIQERNLSSDDFHEALFLWEQKQEESKRKRARLRRERAKEGPKVLPEASSVL